MVAMLTHVLQWFLVKSLNNTEVKGIPLLSQAKNFLFDFLILISKGVPKCALRML